MNRRPPLLTALLFSALPAFGADDNCGEIRDQIESRIRTSGVQRYSLTVVDAAASAPGRTVGTCARGARRIVYAVSGASAPVAAPVRRRDVVITECRDGSAPQNGRCPG